MDEELIEEFLNESRALLDELKRLGKTLRQVRVPNEDKSKRLSEFAQKLNRLIGGTAAMGFDSFSLLSRKTSLLAGKCAEVKQVTIRVIIQNLNTVVSIFSAYFQDAESIHELEMHIPDLENRIDICMAALGMEKPEIKTQSQIDDILASFK